ncbi:hypothetical protein [Methylovulum miyakonense]|uniref:hypothetical protein n=1 Tax=Methylovulum miyakonense TaxID=645578 RepID=UPI00036D0610|nr:hypothetical protein [Methylovulum miyakonense]
MNNNLDDFTNALAEKLKQGNPTPDEIRRLANQYTMKPKRGRPRKKNPVTPKETLARGRPRSDESMNTKFKVMILWVMLDRIDMPQMAKRGIIAKVTYKSRAFVDKAIAKLNELVCKRLIVAGYSHEKGMGVLLPADDAERLQAAWEAGEDIDSILENPEHFHKLELPKIILPKIPKK